VLTLFIRLTLSTWLFISTFLLPHTSASAWNTLLVASLVAAVSLLAFAMPGRPGIRWFNAVLATWLLASVMLLPHVSLATMAHQVGLAMLLALAAFPLPAPWMTRWREDHPPATTR
jgi:hypothetical protein